MKFWEHRGEPYDVVVAPSEGEAMRIFAMYHERRNRPRLREMSREQLDNCRKSVPLRDEMWSEDDRLDGKTIGQFLDEMDAEAAEKKRIAEFEAKQVPLFPEEP